MESDATTPNETFSDYVTKLVEEFVPALEVIFARRLPRDKKEEITQKLELLKSASLQFADRVESIKKSGDMAKFAEISNEYIRAIIPEVNSAVSGLEYVRGALFSPPEVKVPYIRNSKYDEYVKCMKQMIDTAMERGMNPVISYISSVEGAVTDLQAWAQSLAVDIGPIVKHLTPDRKHFSRGLALRCIEEYGKMSGVYERLVKILAGFVSIGSDTAVHYDQFRRRGLASNLGVLKDKGWGTVCREFDILIRNSLAHKSCSLHPSERAVHFADPISGREELISYRLLFEKTRDLSCLVLALSAFMGLVYEAILSKIGSFLVLGRN